MFPRMLRFGAVAQGHQEDGALAFGVRGEEGGHVVVEKRQAGGAQALRIGCEIELAADDAGLKLHGAIARLPKRCRMGRRSARKKMSAAASAGKGLLQSQVSGLVAEISLLQTFEHSAAAMEDVGSGSRPSTA